MSIEHPRQMSSRMQRALEELEGMILAHYPRAQFRVGSSPEDSSVVHLTTTVDVEDTDDVLDVVVDRMMEMQIEEDLPVYVIPIRPRERALQEIRRSPGAHQHAGGGSALTP